MIMDLGPEDVVLGLLWLWRANPMINWNRGTLDMRVGMEGSRSNKRNPEVRMEQIAASRIQCQWLWRAKILEDPSEALWCAAGYTYSTELAEKVGREKAKRTFEEIVPKDYCQYVDVFSEMESERLPEHKPYDHAIDLKPCHSEVAH